MKQEAGEGGSRIKVIEDDASRMAMWREAGQVSGSLSVHLPRASRPTRKSATIGRSMIEKVEHQPLLRTLLPPRL